MNTKLNRQLVENYKVELNEFIGPLVRGLVSGARSVGKFFLKPGTAVGKKLIRRGVDPKKARAIATGINVGVPVAAGAAAAGYLLPKYMSHTPSESPEFAGGGRGEEQPGRGERGSSEKKKYGIDPERAAAMVTAQTPEDLTFAKAGASNRERALARNAIKARMRELKRAGKGPGSEEYEAANARYSEIAPIVGKLQTQPRSNPAATTLGRLNQRGINIKRPPQSEDEARQRAEALADIERENQQLAAQGEKFTGYDNRGQMYAGFKERGYGIGVGKTEPDSTQTAKRISSEVDKDIERRMAEIRKNPKAYGIE